MRKSSIGSLGGNYTWGFARLALWQLVAASPKTLDTLRSRLEQHWGGRVVLTYKGRDAIEYVLRAYGIAVGDQVLTQAFTCHAIEEAITRVGAQPQFVDLGSDSFNPDLKTLEAARLKASHPKAVIIQHTLGVPAAMPSIAAWAQKHKLLLIEDLAQGYGGAMESGESVGAWGDAVVLSFGRDKIIDAVSGGAAILRKTPAMDMPLLSPAPRYAWWRDCFYPSVVLAVRSTFEIGLGKVILKLAFWSGWLRSPVASPTDRMTALPVQLAPLVTWQLDHYDATRQHRQQIAEVYQRLITEALETGQLPNQNWRQPTESVKACSLVRWPIVVRHPDELAAQLVKCGIYLTDRWYRFPVDSGKLQRPSSYQAGSCPRAESLAERIFNLPTHRHISTAQATSIVSACIEVTKAESV